MDGLFWQRLHGGITHLPIVLLPLSVISDSVGLRMRDDAARRAFHSAGVALALAGVLIASALMLGAGYWGGEMLLHAAPENLGATSVLSQSDPSAVMRGHDLFLMNCANCNGEED